MLELILNGCAPEPLMNYLKALGVLRLVSEQADSEARGCWHNDVFVLNSSLDRDSLARFFLNDYKPTPVVGPWAGGSGFFRKDNHEAVTALASSRTDRCKAYREVIKLVHSVLVRAGVKDKPTPDQKAELLRRFRSELPQEAVQWMDAALILQIDAQAFAPALGTGGNDGRLDFSQNFMARLAMLGVHNAALDHRALQWLNNALLGDPVVGLASAKVGQFAPGRAGGPNATQGMEGDATDNPWDFVLMIEGALLLGGAAVRRLGTALDSRAAFPFTVRPSATGFASSSDSDDQSGRGELWLPLWPRPTTLPELRALFGEGRAEIAGRPARDGVDFARAVASLGVDRGIQQFIRLSFLKRSGKAFLAAPLGRVPIRQQQSVDLLRQLDLWLNRFRSACAGKDAPPRLKTALRKIEEAIFELCRYGGTGFFQAIVIAIGRAERELAVSVGKIGKRTITPVASLSADWIHASNDKSLEFALAVALAGIHDGEKKIGSLRSNLEPVEARRGKNVGPAWNWAEKNRAVVWNSGNLSASLAQVLRRRLLDGERNGCTSLPLAGLNFVSLDAISRFLAGELDEQRIEDLLWGLMLVRQPPDVLSTAVDKDAPPLPRAYALLKLLFLSQPLTVNGLSVEIKPELSIVSLLIAGRVGEACQIAMRRLRASGLSPLPHPRSGGVARDTDWKELDFLGSDRNRLAAALLLPLNYRSLKRLRELVIREPATELQTSS
jgi:CRISPR-associated protein Csx17